MCGIAGIVALSPAAGVSEEELRLMAAELRHRGPDGSGLHRDPERRIGFAHTRLSIIDLAGGAQPMDAEAGGLWITYNGEVFNYIELRAEMEARGRRFLTTSDTEVILQAYAEWGDDFLHRLNGQFAFAIMDLRRGRRRVLLARDRAGILPLYLARDGGRVLFASEVKALLPCLSTAPRLDPAALDQIFTFWAPASPASIFEGVEELPPGAMLSIEDGEVRQTVYWDWSFPDAGEHPDGDADLLAEELAALLADATRIRLRSDVPVGSYLSGGLDSSALASFAQDAAGERLRTFSIGFETPELDERAHQRRMAAHLDVDHTEMTCRSADIAADFPATIWHAETPILRTAPAPMRMLSGLVRRSGYRVVLTGEGADEVLGGYDLFKETKVRRFWARQPDSSCRPNLLARLYPYLAGAGAQPAAQLKTFYGVGIEDPDQFGFSHLPRWRTTARCKTFIAPAMAAGAKEDAIEALAAKMPKDFVRWDAFNQAQYLEAKTLMAGYLLSSQGDRMLMANSVEGRFPFLDHRVIEFANRIPPKLKMKVLDEKHLLKRAVRDRLPPEILRRPKQPYRAPDHAAFFAGQPPDYVADLLSEEKLRRYGCFDPGKVRMLVRKLAERPDASTRDSMAFVGILSTQLWCRTFLDNRPPVGH